LTSEQIKQTVKINFPQLSLVDLTLCRTLPVLLDEYKIDFDLAEKEFKSSRRIEYKEYNLRKGKQL